MRDKSVIYSREKRHAESGRVPSTHSARQFEGDDDDDERVRDGYAKLLLKYLEGERETRVVTHIGAPRAAKSSYIS